MVMEWITKLPVDVFSNGVLPYLCVRDLRALHSASEENDSLQSHLHNVWRSYNYDCIEESLVYDDISWLCGVGVHVTSILMQFRPIDLQKTSDIMTMLARFPTLRRFICDSKLPDYMVLTFPMTFPQLELLQVECDLNCSVETFIGSLSQHCRRLRSLALSGCHFGDIVLRSLCDLCEFFPNLCHVSCKYIRDDASVTAFAGAYPHLYSLHLQKAKTSDVGLISIAKRCRELKSMTIKEFPSITSHGLAAFWAANPNLTDVDISGNGFLIDDDIMILLQCCRRLQKLNLSCCYNFTDAAVVAVAEYCPQLISLNIDGCYNISDDALIALGQHCRGLKSIDISSVAFSDVGILALAAGCQLLHEFRARWTNITDASIIALTHGCRDLRKMDI